MRNKLAIPAVFFSAAPGPLAAQHVIDTPVWSNGTLRQSALCATYDDYNRANGINFDAKANRAGSR